MSRDVVVELRCGCIGDFEEARLGDVLGQDELASSIVETLFFLTYTFVPCMKHAYDGNEYKYYKKTMHQRCAEDLSINPE